jgi:hypothetical protein
VSFCILLEPYRPFSPISPGILSRIVFILSDFFLREFIIYDLFYYLCGIMLVWYLIIREQPV